MLINRHTTGRVIGFGSLAIFAAIRRSSSRLMSDLFGDRASGFRAGHGSPNIFDDLAVAFNDQFRGVTRVKHAEAGF